MALTAVLLGGCATGLARMPGDTAARYADYAGAPVDSFTAFHLDGWQALGRDQIVIWTSVNQAYLLKVWDTCHDLPFAERIGIDSRWHSISRLDSIRVGRDRCPISEIRPIDIKRMKADRAAVKAVG